MPVTFVLGRAGSGKTRHCVDAILAGLRAENDGVPLVLLVPEQASFQMERTLARAAPGGGYWRASVVSFSRLAQRVLSDVGLAEAVLGTDARRLALRRVVTEVEPRLNALRRAVRTPGFVAALDQLVDQLLREDISPGQMRDAAGGIVEPMLARKTVELADLYAAYLDWLGAERVDPAARLKVTRARIASQMWLRGARVWIDGFAGFTGQELATVVALAQAARECTITLLLDPSSPVVTHPERTPDPLGLFERTERTYQELVARLQAANVAIDSPMMLRPAPLPRFVATPQLARLEAGLAQPVGAGRGEGGETAGGASDGAAGEQRLQTGATGPQDVRIVACATHRDELHAAARWIRTQIADSGGALRYRDFAVIARDLADFSALVTEVFDEYGIPHFVDRRRSLGAHPIAQLIPVLLEAIVSDFDVRPSLRLLRTRLVPIERDAAERLENVIARFAVRGQALWQAGTWSFAEVDGRDDSCPAGRERILAGIAPLVRLFAGGTAEASGGTWAATLHDVLQRLGVRKRLTRWIVGARETQAWEAAELHRLAWEALCEALEGLHEVLHDVPLSADEVARIIGDALRDTSRGLAPPTLDQVLVSAIERSRHPEIRHAWVIALNEGVFPARPREELVLSAAERDVLTRVGMPAALSRREDVLAERLLAYIACTRPSDSLVISYATRADDGAELLPSPLLDEVRHALPEVCEVRAADDAPPVCVAELARRTLRARAAQPAVATRGRLEALCASVGASAVHGRRLRELLRGADYRNQPEPLDGRRVGRGEVLWEASASEIDTFLQCPFQHFAERVLRLDPSRGPQALALDFGSMAHELLAAVTLRAAAEPGGVHEVADARWLALLDEAAAEYARRQMAHLAACRPEVVSLGAVQRTLLGDVLLAHAHRWRRGRFAPEYCERGFRVEAAEGELAALRLTLADGRQVWVRGKIDRVDGATDGQHKFYLVYDYKSRVASVNRAWLTGGALQLFIYALALEQVEGGTLAGVFLAPLHPDLKVLTNAYAAEADADAQRMYMLRPRGMFVERVATWLDRELGEQSSPVAQMQLKKDGTLYKSSDTIEPRELKVRCELARETIAYAAAGYAAGCIDVAPLVEERTLACRYCDYWSVCRFERVYNRPRVAEAALPHRDPDGASVQGGMPWS